MSDNKIRSAIQELVKSDFPDELYWIAGSVNSVDQAKRLCSITAITGNSDLEIPDVKLQAEVADGLLLIPKLGSTVFVAHTKRNEPYVALFSDIDHVLLVVGSSAIEIGNDGSIKLNDGSFGGLIKIGDLVGKLNTIENKLNSVISSFNSHSHPANGSPPTVPITGTLTPTQRADLENTEITHGQ